MAGGVWKCQQCGNLHGARVDACGMCGATEVALVVNQPPIPPGVASEAKLDALIDALIDLAHAGAAWLEAHTPDDDDDQDDLQD